MPKIRLILQVDATSDITPAAKLLFSKKPYPQNPGYENILYVRNGQTANYRAGNPHLLGLALDETSPVIDKIIIIGHGDGGENSKTVGNLKPDELAGVVESLFASHPNKKITIGRITIDACEMDGSFADQLRQAFTNNNGRINPEKINYYTAMVSTDSKGHRFTTTLEYNSTISRYKDTSVKVSVDKTYIYDPLFSGLEELTRPPHTGDIISIDAAPTFEEAIKQGTLEADLLKTKTIDSFLINSLLPSGGGEGKFQLYQIFKNDANYWVLTPNRTDDSKPAYFLPSIIDQSNSPSWIDIPKIAGNTPKLLFTQALTGGSLVVADHPDKSKQAGWYRVYHDTRRNASVFYDNVRLAVDYEDYALLPGEKGYAASTAFLYYGGEPGKEKWTIVNQPLKISDEEISEPVQRSGANITIKTDYRPLDLGDKFKNARYVIHEIRSRYKINNYSADETLLAVRVIQSLKTKLDELDASLNKENINLIDFDKQIDQTTTDLKNAENALLYIETEQNHNNKAGATIRLYGGQLKALQKKSNKKSLGSKSHFEFENIIEKDILYHKTRKAASNLLSSNSTSLNPDHEHIPLFHAIESVGPNRINIPVLNATTGETTIFSSEDKHLAETKEYWDEQTKALSEGDPIDGLNAALTIQALMAFFSHRSQSSKGDGKDYPPLAKALEIHTYFNLVQAGYGTAMDVKNMVRLTQSVYSEGIIATESTVSRVSGALSHIAEGAGLVLGLGNMVLDSIELSKADTSSQKAIFGTQLAFDTTSTLLSVTGIGVGLLGASAAGAVLSGAGVLLGGLAVGFTGLAQAFGEVADNAEHVGLYFDSVFNAYKKGYYLDKSTSPNIARIDFGAVVTKLDLYAGKVTFGSQMLYRTHHGGSGSGKINYFFWAGDMPEEVRDRNQAINVRQVWSDNYARGTRLWDKVTLPEIASDIPVVLPGTPRSYIGYQYNLLPGSTTKQATGFDLWRIMEEDERFDFDFYIFPFERIIDTLYQEYEYPFEIEVVLDNVERQLIVPALPEKIKGSLHYKIYNQGCQCDINLNAGVRLNLSTAANKSGAIWRLYSGSINEDFTVDVKNRQLILGDTYITVDEAANQEILIVRKNKEVCQVDMATGVFTTSTIDAGAWTINSLQDHLKELAKAHQLASRYVLIKNFEPSDDKVNAGNAFYDAQEDRFLYTSGLPLDVTDSANLMGVLEGRAFFLSITSNRIWATDIKTAVQSKEYPLLLKNEKTQIERVWISGSVVSILQSVQPAGAKKVELIYQINNDTPTLLRVSGADDLIRKLTGANPISSDTDLATFLSDNIVYSTENAAKPASSPPAASGSAPALGEIITITTDSPDIDKKLIWLHTQKKIIVIPNMIAAKDFNYNTGRLSLIHCASNRKDQTVHYFLYNPNPDVSPSDTPVSDLKAVRLFIQTANDPAYEVLISGLLYAMSQGDKLYATTNQGQIFYVNPEGDVFLEALTDTWLRNNAKWWEALPSLAKNFLVSHTNIPLLGLTVAGNGKKPAFPVWYDVVKKSIAISPVSLFNTVTAQDGPRNLAFLGIAAQKRGAYFLDTQSKAVYWQMLPIYPQLEAACAKGTDNLDLSAFPDSKQVLADQKIVNAYIDQDQLYVVLDEGLLWSVDHEENVNIAAVQHIWVKQNRNTLLSSLKDLCDKYKYREEALSIFAANDPNDNSLSWYLPAQQILLSPPVQPGQVLTYIGYNAANKTAFFADMGASSFLTFKDKKLQRLFKFGWVTRFPDMLGILGSETGDTIPAPVFDNCTKIIFATHFGSNRYSIGAEAWQHYDEITVDNGGAAPDLLLLPFPDFNQLSALRYGEDLLVVESDTGRYATLKKVFDPATRGGILIQTSNSASVHSAKIVSIMNTNNLTSLDLNIPGLALKRVKIKPLAYPNQNLRIDATGVVPHSSGGIVNGKFYDVGPTEQFYLIGQPDGTFGIESVAFPGVYLRIDAKDVTKFLTPGGGIVNSQFGMGPLTKFYVVPHGAGVAFASQASPGVYLRYDGSSLVGAPNGKIGGVANCQFGAQSLEGFNIFPVD